MCTTGLDRIARKRSFAWRSPLADPQYLGLLSAGIEKALEDSAFGAIRVFGHDEVAEDSSSVREVWRAQNLRNSYSPAVAHEAAVYGIGGGQLFCLDAGNGRTLWQARVGDGTMIRVDDHLVVFGQMTGQLRLVEATTKGYSEIANASVFPSRSHGPTPPSFGAGRIFLRGAGEIAAVRPIAESSTR